MSKIYDNATLDGASILIIKTLLNKIDLAIQECAPDADLRFELVRRTQQLAIESRLLYGRACEPDDNQEAKSHLHELGYRCECRADEVRIELPLLLPKRGADASFVTNPLHELLSLERNLPRFQHCIVVVEHVYGGDKKTADIGDHDNIESRAVLNVIERYFLTSDSGYYTSVCCGIATRTCSEPSSSTNMTGLPETWRSMSRWKRGCMIKVSSLSR